MSIDLHTLESTRLHLFELAKFSLQLIDKSHPAFSDAREFGKRTCAIFNLAFSCELALKQLLYSSGNGKSGHDLKKLFEAMSDVIQEQIRLNYNESIKNSKFTPIKDQWYSLGNSTERYDKLAYRNFDKSLESNKDCFITFRYYFEMDNLTSVAGGSVWRFNHSFLYYFYMAIDQVIKSQVENE